MPERQVEGVNVRETGLKQWQFDYTESDVEALYRRGDWHSWQDEINWLERFGEQDNELTPGETIAMTEDLRSLESRHAPFTSDPDQAYEMAHKFRAENNQRYAQQHGQGVGQAGSKRR